MKLLKGKNITNPYFKNKPSFFEIDDSFAGETGFVAEKFEI